MVIAPLLPSISYAVYTRAHENEVNSLNIDAASEIEDNVPDDPVEDTDEIPLPKQSLALSSDPTLIINKISINGVIQENPDPDKTLENGPWLVNDLGTPIDNQRPIIVA